MRLLLFLLLFVPALRLHAQQVEVTRHDVDQGLPQSMVNHVLQDRDGFIWLGTGDGLARFDGRNFVVYKHDPRDSTSLSHNSIWGLAEQDERHLWVGTRLGLDLFDRSTGRFTHLRTGGELDGCWTPLTTDLGGRWFYSSLCKAFLVADSTGITRWPQAHQDSYAMRTTPDGRSVTQFLRPDSLIHIDLQDRTERVQRLPVLPEENVTDILDLGDRWLVLTDRNGWTWSATAGRIPLPANTRAVLERVVGGKYVGRAPDGTCWLGISGVGVVTLSQELEILGRYPLVSPDQRPLSITRIHFDRQGNTWVGTDGKGVFRIAPQRVGIGRCMPGQGLPWEPASWFVRGFAQWDPDRVLVSLYQGGLVLFDERTGLLAPLEVEGIGPRGTADLQALCNDGAGRVWMKQGPRVLGLDPGSGRIVFERLDPCVSIIGRSTDGDTYLASSCLPFLRMGHRADDAGPTPWNGGALSGFMTGLHGARQRLYRDQRQRWWGASEALPISLFAQGAPLPMPQVLRRILPPLTHLNDLVEQGDALWMATNNGLYHLRAADLHPIRHYTVHDGLPDQYLYALLPGRNGSWWISTNNGLGHLDPATGTFTPLGTEEGAQTKEYNGRAAFRSASGRLYFGGVNGFNHFQPDLPRSDPDTALIRIIGLTVMDSTMDLRALGAMPTVSLPHGRNSVRIDLAVLEFTAPERNSYRYRIPGYADLTSHPADRPIILANMPAGTYVLEVSGVNADGVVSRPSALLTIHVPLPFWASPWAFVLIGSLVAATLGGVGFALYRRRVKDRMARAEQQMQELRIRTRLAHDLHDDVGSGLAHIGALARMAERLTGKGELPAEQVAKVKDISQELMDNLRDVVWVNDPTDGDLPTLLIRMKDHVRDLFEPGGVTCTFDLPIPLPERGVGNAFKRNLFLLFKEAAHNAFKYSGTERIELRFTLDAHTFTCALTDHGSGVQHGPAKGGGHGLANMRERAEEIGARLDIASTAGGGTTVSVSGPLSCLDH